VLSEGADFLNSSILVVMERRGNAERLDASKPWRSMNTRRGTGSEMERGGKKG